MSEQAVTQRFNLARSIRIAILRYRLYIREGITADDVAVFNALQAYEREFHV